MEWRCSCGAHFVVAQLTPTVQAGFCDHCVRGVWRSVRPLTQPQLRQALGVVMTYLDVWSGTMATRACKDLLNLPFPEADLLPVPQFMKVNGLPQAFPDQVHQRLPYTPFFPAYAVQAAGLRAMVSRVEYEVMVRVRDQEPLFRPARAVVRSTLHRVLRMAWTLDDVADDSDSEFTLAAVAAKEREYSPVTAASTRASSLSLTQFNPHVHL